MATSKYVMTVWLYVDVTINMVRKLAMKNGMVGQY